MATSVGNLFVNLTTRTDAFSQGFASATKDVQSFGVSLSGLGGVAARATAALGALVGAAGAIGSLKTGVQLAADAESAEVAFGTLLGSVEQAKEILSDLSDFAASTPFQLGDLRSGAQQLLAFGVESEDLMRRLQLLGDIAAGTGKPIADFVDIFGKVKAGGVAALGDINRLADRGVPIFRVLAEEMGVAQTEVRKLASTGKVTFDVLARSLERTVAAGEVFAGGMEKQSRTVNGLFSTLKDNVSFALQDIGEALIREVNLKGFLESAIEGVQAIRDILAPIAGTLIKLGTVMAGAAAGFVAMKVATLAYAAAQQVATSAMIFFQAVASPKNLAKVAAGIAGATVAVAAMGAAYNATTKAAMAQAGAAEEAVEATKGMDDVRFGLVSSADGAVDLEKKLKGLAQRLEQLAELRDAVPEIADKLSLPVFESIDDITKFNSDAEQANTEVRALEGAFRQIQGLARAGLIPEALGAEASTRIAGEIGKLTGFTDEVEKARHALEIERGKISEIDIKLASLLDAGALPEQVNELRDTLTALDQVKFANKLADRFAALRTEIGLLSGAFTQVEADANSLLSEGATQEQIDQFRQLNDELAAARKQADLRDEGTALAQSLRTPLETFEQRMRHLSELFNSGAIDMTTLFRARDEAEKNFLDAQEQAAAKPDAGPVAAIQAGTAEAFSTIQSALRGMGDPEEDTAKNTKAIASDTRKLLDEIKKQTKPQTVSIPV